MSEFEKILYPALITLGGGVFLLVLGQFFTKLIIEPLNAFREVRGEISYNLVFYANIICNPEVIEDESLKEAKKAFRHSAAQIRAKALGISGYWIVSGIRLVPKKENVFKASSLLIRLSNTSAQRPNPVRSNNDIGEINYLLGLEKKMVNKTDNLNNN